MSSSKLKSILLVDDDEMGNLLNKIFIDQLNLDAEVDVALNGKEALEFLNEKGVGQKGLLLTPCLLLLDINMPEMDGWEFLEHYERTIPENLKSKIVIVMLTTSEEEKDKIRALNNQNIREFVKKPLSENKINGLIKTYFTGHESFRPA